MRRTHSSLIVIAISFILVGWNFPDNTGPVVDQADVFTSDQEHALTEELNALQNTSGTAAQIVTVTSLEGQTVERYGRVLFMAWHSGSTGRHFVLLVAPTERKVYADWSDVLNGPLNNDVRHRISVDTIRPRWRAGQRVEAIVFGLREFEQLLAPGFMPPAGALFAPAPISQTEVQPQSPRHTQRGNPPNGRDDGNGLLLIKGLMLFVLLALVSFIGWALWYWAKIAIAKRDFRQQIKDERADVELRQVEFDALVTRARFELSERLLAEELSTLIAQFADAKKGALELIKHADSHGEISIQAGNDALASTTTKFRGMTTAHKALEQLFISTVGARDSLAREIKAAEDEIGRINTVLIAARSAGYHIPVTTVVIANVMAGYREAAVQALDTALNPSLALITAAKDSKLLMDDPLLALDKLREAVELAKALEQATESHIEKAGRYQRELRTVEGDLTSAKLQYTGRERELVEAKRTAPEGAFADSDDNLALAKDQLDRANEKVATAKDQADSRQAYTEALETLKSVGGHIDGAKLKIGLVLSQIKKHEDAAKSHTLDRMSAVGSIATAKGKIEESGKLSLLEDLKRAYEALDTGDAFASQSPPSYLAAVRKYQDASTIANDLKQQAQRAITEAAARSTRGSTNFGSSIGSGGGGFTNRSSGSRGGGGKSSAPRSPGSTSRFGGGMGSAVGAGLAGAAVGGLVGYAIGRSDDDSSNASTNDAGGSSSGWDSGGDTGGGGGGNDGGNGGGDDL